MAILQQIWGFLSKYRYMTWPGGFVFELLPMANKPWKPIPECIQHPASITIGRRYLRKQQSQAQTFCLVSIVNIEEMHYLPSQASYGKFVSLSRKNREKENCAQDLAMFSDSIKWNLTLETNFLQTKLNLLWHLDVFPWSQNSAKEWN